MTPTEHAAHCNISEGLSEECSCGADGSPTFDTYYSESYVNALRAELATAHARIDTLEGALQKLLARRDRFEKSDGNQQNAYYAFVKGASGDWNEARAAMKDLLP